VIIKLHVCQSNQTSKNAEHMEHVARK
jgi:hypothetical protein